MSKVGTFHLDLTSCPECIHYQEEFQDCSFNYLSEVIFILNFEFNTIDCAEFEQIEDEPDYE